MQDRELKSIKEEKLFDLHYARCLLKKGSVKEAEKYLATAEDRSQSGMTADEIDAVKERVNRTIND